MWAVEKPFILPTRVRKRGNPNWGKPMEARPRATDSLTPRPATKTEAVSPHLLSVFCDELCAGGGTVLPDRKFAE